MEKIPPANSKFQSPVLTNRLWLRRFFSCTVSKLGVSYHANAYGMYNYWMGYQLRCTR
jgi:hypothetical protein